MGNCRTCGGSSKTIQCPVCKGSGKVTGKECPNCGGARKIVCPTCHGTGKE